jgi:hypothetical protein
MNHHFLLLFDAFINFVLGILLIIFPINLAQWMGLPILKTNFYIHILGAVFVGIGLALLWEVGRDKNNLKGTGLGVIGAALINLCGGVMLAYWLIAGKLALTIPGLVFLWLLVILLVGISVLEVYQRSQKS